MSHEAEDGKDDKTSKDASSAVEDGDDEGIAIAVVLEPIVWWESDESTPRHTKGVEDLYSCVFPHLGRRQLFPAWRDKEFDSFNAARKGDAADEENEQHTVGEDSGEIYDLQQDGVEKKLISELHISIRNTKNFVLLEVGPVLWQDSGLFVVIFPPSF